MTLALTLALLLSLHTWADLCQLLDSRQADFVTAPHSPQLQTPIVFQDSVAIRVFTDDKVREYFKAQADKPLLNQMGPRLTDLKQLADARPKWGKNSPPPWLDVNPYQLSSPEVESYIYDNYELPSEVPRSQNFSDFQWRPHHPLLTPRNHIIDPTSLVGKALQNIHETWTLLLRPGQPEGEQETSLLSVPKDYISAGGRFREMYFWDSYWIMKGLIESGYDDLAKGMLENFIYLFETYGIIPNGNRFYYLSRSQPPVLMEMVLLFKEHGILNFTRLNPRHQGLRHNAEESLLEARILDVAQKYYERIWKGTDRFVSEYHLFRYWDDSMVKIRPERGLMEPASLEGHGHKVFGEAAWDFSYTRFKDRPQDFLPVDLNSLLVNYTRSLSDILKESGADLDLQKHYLSESQNIQRSIENYLFHNDENLFVDYDMKEAALSETITAASFWPYLYLHFPDPLPPSSSTQAKQLKRLLEHLKPLGYLGLRTTNREGAGQWDGSWTWAPLVETAYQALKRHQLHEEALSLAEDFSLMVLFQYYTNGYKFFEKYWSLDGSIEIPPDSLIYGNEIGFGWTNGVLSLLIHELQRVNRLNHLNERLLQRLPDRFAAHRIAP